MFRNLKNYLNSDDPLETSTSSENSPTNSTRKHKTSYQSRKVSKSTQNLSKRHVRSSSGYSSHNDETTFR